MIVLCGPTSCNASTHRHPPTSQLDVISFPVKLFKILLAHLMIDPKARRNALSCRLVDVESVSDAFLFTTERASHAQPMIGTRFHFLVPKPQPNNLLFFLL
jgi:hypothetical protein